MSTKKPKKAKVEPERFLELLLAAPGTVVAFRSEHKRIPDYQPALFYAVIEDTDDSGERYQRLAAIVCDEENGLTPADAYDDYLGIAAPGENRERLESRQQELAEGREAVEEEEA
jgi:hypothetical protein